jgi:hypothetical protein
MRQIRTDPAGFNAGSYGVAFVLAGDGTTSQSAGSGYAVALGNSGPTDPIRLVKYSAGLGSLSNLITSNTSGLTDFGNHYVSVKVTYDPSSNTWELFLRNDGTSAFSDPAVGSLDSQGTIVDNTYTSTALASMGAYWGGSSSADQTAFFDNVSVKVASVSPTITLSTNTLTNFGTVQVSTSSADQSYTVEGANLTDTLHLLAPPQFEISFSSGSGYASSLYLLPTTGTVANTTIYARFSPTSNGAVSDSIAHTSLGATTKKVGVSGTGASCSAPLITPSGPTTFCTGGSVMLTSDPGVSYLWSSGETTQSITVTAAGNYSVAMTDGSNCTATSAVTTVSVNSFGFSGIIFSENMGSPIATTLVNAYTGWQNYGVLGFASTTTNQSDVRTTGASSGYTGASASGNVFLGTAGSSARDFIISNINTAGYTGLTLSFGLLRDNNTDNLIVSVSTDGVVYTPVTTSAQPPTNNVWALVTVTSGIPSAPNLRIKFEKATGTQFRIDDIILSGSASAVSISASGSTTICSGSYVTLTSSIPSGNDWSFSPIFTFSQSVQANLAGDYFTIVSDNNGCTVSSDTITVTVVSAPTVSASTTDALCAGDSTGTATAVGSGGAGGYTYSWDSNPVQTTDIATGLPAGSYTVTVTDAGGCTGTTTVSVGEPTPLQVATISSAPSTIGGSDGTATAFAYDGTGPYTYSWNTAPVQTTAMATGLTAGTYDVTATDFNGCTATAQAVVVDPIPEITVSTTTIADFGNVVVGNSSAEDVYTVSGVYLSDSILITAPADFEISLTSNSGFTNIISLYPSSGTVNSTAIYARFTPSAVGPASGTITHQSTGATQKDVTVSGTGISCAQATITAGGPTSFCSGGSVTLTASAGASYLWSTAETTQSIVVTTSGSYTVDVTDAFNCTSTSAAEVVTVNSFTYTGALFTEDMGTPGGNTLVNNYTGWLNPGAVFQSTLTNQSDVRTSTASTGYSGATGSGNVFMGTAGGTNPRDFIISGINTLGYTGLSLSFGMLRTATNELLAVSVSTDGISYSPITTTQQPGSNNWALVSDSIGTIPSVSNLYLKFEKATSTGFRIDDITISGTTNTLIVTANGPTTICGGATLVLTSNIGAGNDWSPFPSFSQSISVTASGTYSTTVTDINGCSATSATFTVNANPSPAVDTLISTNLLCNNDSSGTITAQVSGGTTPYTYSWSTVPTQTTIGVTDLHSGYYTFTVTDVNGCTASQGRFVSQPSALAVTASVISDPSSIGASDGSIASAASGGTTPYTYSWNSAPVQTTDTATNLPAGTYIVTVTDSNGCNIDAAATLNDPLPEIFVSTTTIPDFGNVLIGNTSTEEMYTVSGINLTDSILITAPTDFEISLTSGSGFGSQLSLYPTLGTVSSTQIFVHFVPSAGGAISGLIEHTSTGATQKDVLVSGTGTTCSQATITPSGPLSFCAGGNVTLTASSGATYLWSDGQTTSSIFVDTSGTFSVIVTDAFACSSTSASVTVTVNAFAYVGAIFSEDMGNSGGTTALNPYTGWQNYGVLGFSTNTTGPSDVRTSSGSNYVGASGFSNVFMGTAGSINPRDFIISGVNTMGYSSMLLTFGMHRTSTAESLTVEVSTDGVSYTALTTSTQPNSNTWALVTATGAIPNTSNLYIKFSKATNVSFRIDDVKLEGTVTTPTISAGGPTTFCQGSQVTLTSNIPTGNLWSPGLQTTQSIVVNSTDTYGLTVTDQNGCTASAVSVSTTVNPLPVITTSATDVSCNGGSDGTATANVTVGLPAYLYSWNGGVQTSQTATGLSAGNHTVVVTDANGCIDSALTTIVEPALLVTTCSGTDISCNGLTDGIANVSETGGTGPYTYSWTDATPTTFTVTIGATKDNNIFADNTSNSNAKGPNFVAGSNGSGFARRALLAFDIASNIPAGATITAASLDLNMVHTSGSAGPQNFDLHSLLENWGEATSLDAGNPGNGVPATPGDATWNNSFDPGTLWTTPGGTYAGSVSASTIVDAIGSYTWTSAGMVSDVQNWLDNAVSDYGWILIGNEASPLTAKRFDSRENLVPANQPALTITYSVSPVLGTSNVLTGLGAGTYTVVVTDFNGCTSSCDVTINEPTLVVATCSVLNHVTCNGGSDGAVSVVGSGGTGAIAVSGPPTSGLSAGSYTYTLTDANGCTTTCTLVITEPAAIVIGSFNPTSGPIGTSVIISGSGFTGATDVQFNGVSAAYTVDNDAQITATVPPTATTGPITVIVGSCQTISAGTFTVGSASVDLDLTLYLEGFYVGGGTMVPTLFDLGMEFGGTETDYITIDLWSQSAVTANIAPDYSETVILHNNGLASASFTTATPGYYYIAIRHRNTLETWSKDSVNLTAGLNTYNFSTSLTQAYDDGFNPPMQNMGGGVFALYSGDVNQDYTIDGSDLADIDNDNSIFAFGYNPTDCSGDGATDGTDLAIVDNNQVLFLFYARPY